MTDLERELLAATYDELSLLDALDIDINDLILLLDETIQSSREQFPELT